jgi:hypothetical protein
MEKSKGTLNPFNFFFSTELMSSKDQPISYYLERSFSRMRMLTFFKKLKSRLRQSTLVSLLSRMLVKKSLYWLLETPWVAKWKVRQISGRSNSRPRWSRIRKKELR